MNVALWIIQALLALVFLGAGLMKATRPLPALETNVGAWVHDVPLPVIRLTGAAEVLGAAGLVLVRAFDGAWVLTGLAAVGLAIIMLGAIVIHGRRDERKEVGLNAALLALLVVVAAGRI